MRQSGARGIRQWIAAVVGFVATFIAVSVIQYLILGDPQPVLALVAAACGSIGAMIALSIADARHRKGTNGESS